MESTFTKEEILNAAEEQKILCWLFFAMIVIQLFAVFSKGNDIIYSIGALAHIFFLIWTIVTVYRLAKYLKKKYCWLYVVGMFFPLINLIILLVLIQNATKILRANNIAVGVMGARKQSLNDYQNQPAIK